MRRVAIRDGIPHRRCTGGCSVVSVLASLGRTVVGVVPDLRGVEYSITVVAAGVSRAEVVTQIAWRPVVVDHDYGVEVGIAGVGNNVGPGNIAAHGNERSGWCIGILAIGVLFDVNGRLDDPRVLGDSHVKHISVAVRPLHPKSVYDDPIAKACTVLSVIQVHHIVNVESGILAGRLNQGWVHSLLNEPVCRTIRQDIPDVGQVVGGGVPWWVGDRHLVVDRVTHAVNIG